MKRAFWDELGGFDLTFVMYGEETDLCHRARARGARPRITPDATIVHYAGASSKRRSDKDALILKSKVTLAQRYLPRWQHGPAVFLLRMWPLSRKLGGQLAAQGDGQRRRRRGRPPLGRGLGGPLELAGRLRAAAAPRADPGRVMRAIRGADLGPGAAPGDRPAREPAALHRLDRLPAPRRLDGPGARLRRALLPAALRQRNG